MTRTEDARAAGLPDVRVRAATEDDDAALGALDRATWSPQVNPGRAPQTTTFLTERRRPEDVVVAAVGDRVIGYAILQQQAGMPSHEHVLLLNGLAVDPRAQGQGLGQRLVRFCQAEAVRRGVRKLSLRVLSTNRRAQRLYESCGFTVEGVLRAEFEIEGRLVDDVLMAWFAPDAMDAR